MDAIESHAVGRCEGYRPGTVFKLSDGTAWVQVSHHEEYVLRDRLRARDWRDSAGAFMLDPEELSGVARVEGWGGNLLAGSGGVQNVSTHVGMHITN